MLVLQNNIHIIAGAKRYCLYDLNKLMLYSLDSQDVELIWHITNGGSATEASQDTVNYLKEAGIIVEEQNLIPTLQSEKYYRSLNFAWIEITQNCNLICRHCYEGASREKIIPQMSIDSFKHVVEELKSVGIDRVQLVGGEPLMHSEIEKLMAIASHSFSFVEVFTNGTLLNDHLFEIIEKTGISLAFSLYSDTPELHDYVTRTPGSYELTYRSIEQTKKRGIELRISSVEMKNLNQFTLSGLEEYHRTDLPRLTGRADLSLYDRNMLKRKLITKKTFSKPIDVHTYFANQNTHNCFGRHLYIDYELNVFPCVMERRYSYGNLFEKSLDAIIGNGLSGLTKDHISGCKDCEFRYACFDCRPDANGNSLYSKPWYCTYNPEHGEWEDENIFIDSLFRG